MSATDANVDSGDQLVANSTDAGQANPELQPAQQSTRRKTAATAAPPAPPDSKQNADVS